MTEHAGRLLAVGAICLSLLTACSDSTPVLHEAQAPSRLSDWNLFHLDDRQLVPVEDSLVFRPASTLFTDYAQKLRSLWIPDGEQARIRDGELVYPVGSILSKTFYYPEADNGAVLKQADLQQQSIELSHYRLIETRLLVKRADGWDAYPYVWNAEESEAFLRVAGATSQLTLVADGTPVAYEEPQGFNYFVPNQNQCSGCHQTEHPDGDMEPLGARLEQLASGFNNNESQLQNLQARGWLKTLPQQPTAVDWQDQDQSLEARAQAYLNMNCGHCHNPEGPADTSALILDGSASNPAQLGICKPPVAAGGGAGNLLYGIVPGQPETSILHYRMQSIAADEMMPELGRSLVHEEGLALVSNWISNMTGSCD